MKDLIPQRTDRAALGTWLLASLAAAWFSIVVIRVIPHQGDWPDYLTRWNQWDADRFWWLATYGYDGGPPGRYEAYSWPAFFPGYPMVIRLVGTIITDYRAAGLLISFLTGPLAALALSRLTNDTSLSSPSRPTPPTPAPKPTRAPRLSTPKAPHTPEPPPADHAKDAPNGRPPSGELISQTSALPAERALGRNPISTHTHIRHSSPPARPSAPPPEEPPPAPDDTAHFPKTPETPEAAPRPPEIALRTSEATPRPPETALQTSEAALRNSEAVPQAPEAALQTSEAVLRTPEAALQTPEIALRNSEAVPQAPEAALQTSEAVLRTPEAALQTPEIALRNPEAVPQAPETALRTPESASRIPGTALRNPEAAPRTPGAALQTSEAAALRNPEAISRTSEAALRAPESGSRASEPALRAPEQGGAPTAVVGRAEPGDRDGDGSEESAERSWRTPGFYAVLALVTSPCAVFLFAAYSEALFLALAIPAWLLAKKGRWELAVLCAAAASIVRITGLFLALGLIVEFLVGKNGRKGPDGWRNAPYLIAPFLSIGAYMGYQWHRTGDPMAWQHAQEQGWNRHMVMPWEAFETTWYNAFTIDTEWSNAFRVEIVAAAVGVLLVLWLAYQRQWPETIYISTQLAAFMTSSFYLSIGRATLLWFPLWITLGHLMTRHRWLPGLYLALSLPLSAAFIASFTQGQWTG